MHEHAPPIEALLHIRRPWSFGQLVIRILSSPYTSVRSSAVTAAAMLIIFASWLYLMKNVFVVLACYAHMSPALNLLLGGSRYSGMRATSLA